MITFLSDNIMSASIRISTSGLGNHLPCLFDIMVSGILLHTTTQDSTLNSFGGKHMAQLIHLYVHTEWSLLDSVLKISDIVRKALEYKLPAVAITDHGHLSGVKSLILWV